MPILTCPCFSGKPYAECCEIYHKGGKAETPVKLMRSRYSAYALGLTEYIQRTTHPKSPHAEKNKAKWSEGIQHFSKNTQFVGLDILDNHDNEVVFYAHLKTLSGQDISFKEHSIFSQEDGVWLYVDRA